MNIKAEEYGALVLARKACRACSALGLVNASEIRNGEYDSDQIGPWSQSLGDLNARVMVIGQDWGDQRAFEKQTGHDWPSSATNQMLRALLAAAGIHAPDGDANWSPGVFLTNAVLCFRRARGCQGPVQRKWFENCGQRYLRPQIELINPLAVICLGERAYGAVRATYQLPPIRNWRLAVEGSGVALAGRTTVFPVYHCGRRILNTHRDRDSQIRDWERIGVQLRRL